MDTVTNHGPNIRHQKCKLIEKAIQLKKIRNLEIVIPFYIFEEHEIPSKIGTKIVRFRSFEETLPVATLQTNARAQKCHSKRRIHSKGNLSNRQTMMN